MALTGSPRDHAADSNPDVARKRARLSESPTSGEEVHIEVLAPEDIGATPIGAIHIDDDEEPVMMEAYSDSFRVLAAREPVAQVNQLLGQLTAGEYYLETECFDKFSAWLESHILAAQQHSREDHLHAYSADEPFFSQFALLGLNFLQHDHIFDPAELYHTVDFNVMVATFIVNLVELCLFHIQILPDVVKEKMARRDSAQLPPKPGHKHINTLRYIQFLAMVFWMKPKETKYLRQTLRVNIKHTRDVCVERIRSQPGTFKSLVLILAELSQNAREVDGAWLYISSILKVVRYCAADAGESAEDVVSIVNQNIMPAICEKHPRALPEGFHDLVAKTCSEAISNRASVKKANARECQELYERLVKGDDDALFSEHADATPVLDSLCDGDGDVRALLLRTAWYLQALKSFVFSSIMDIRSVGIIFLSNDLQCCIKDHCDPEMRGVEHPVIQYTARFLRKSDLTKYIFSADSHASIIGHSQDIVNFLAVTQHYTDQETDTIWQACTTSVEADFVKASFAVLQYICRNIGFQQLLYVAEKYTTTPITKLSNQAAVDTLPALYRYLHETSPPDDVQGSILKVIRSALRLLQHLHQQEHTPASAAFKYAAMTEVQGAANLSVGARVEIYKDCIPAILNKTELATVSVAVLALFLKKPLPEEEASQLVDMLPVTGVIDEVCQYVESAKKPGILDRSSRETELRSYVTIILRLLSLSADPQQEVANNHRLYSHLVGDSAIDNFARDTVWRELIRLAPLSGSDKSALTASMVLHRYVSDFVPGLPAEYATGALIDSLVQSLGSQYASEVEQGHCPMVLEHAAWKTLVRFAAESPDQRTSQTAVNAVCQVLFGWRQTAQSKQGLVDCHVRFVRDYVHDLCHDFADFACFQSPVDAQRYRQAIRLLSTVLERSRAVHSALQLPRQMETMTLAAREDDEGDDAFCFSLQFYPPQSCCSLTCVKASKTNTVADLAMALPTTTGVPTNRVILSGRMVDLEADAGRTLADVGVRPSGVLMICPIYTPDSDLDTVLTALGPVEQEILAQHDRLEPFLDAPLPVAECTYNFLRTMRPSTAARARICSVSSSATDLFPSQHPYRMLYSCHILKAHLTDFARLGVADQSFIQHGVRLLTACIMDETQVYQSNALIIVVGNLDVFLQERPKDSGTMTYFEDAARFASRMVNLVSQTTSVSTGASAAPGSLLYYPPLASAAYKVLLQAARVQKDVWSSFATNDNFDELHTTILLDDGVISSGVILPSIINFCAEEGAPESAVDTYWRAIIATVPNAVEKTFGTAKFFDVAIETLNRNSTLQASEVSVRELIQTLLQELWNHGHAEVSEYPGADEALVGLLKLLACAVTVLKSFKKPLELHRLSADLFGKLLFPSFDAMARPMLNETSRGLVFDLVRATAESAEDYDGLARLAVDAMQPLPHHLPQQFPGYDNWMRAPELCAGLTNLGMTCYMNSLLQQLFANLSFRKFIFDTPVVDEQRQIFLKIVQDLFVHMQDSPSTAADTTNLANVLAIATDSQEDVHTFYSAFLSRLEDSMLDAQRRSASTGFFRGKLISQVRGECGHVSAQSEAFTELAITVKNKASLQESLDEFVQGEPMQGSNKYKCQTCDAENGGRLVDAMKRTCLDETPDNVTFCLKRFTFEAMWSNEGKVNDRFDFPAEIDLSRYQRSHLDQPTAEVQPDVFELVGVIVHQGTLEYGHYWSYVRLGGSAERDTWVRLEDKLASICQGGIQEVQANCSGGLLAANGSERTDNAYVLFYRRRDVAQREGQLVKQPRLPVVVARRLPPRLETPNINAMQEVLNELRFRWRVSHLFGAQFANFMNWLISTCPAAIETGTDQRAVMDAQGVVDLRVAELANSLAFAAERYLLRLVLTDPTSGKKAEMFADALGKAELRHSNRIAVDSRFIGFIADDPLFLAYVWRFGDSEYRAVVADLILSCLDTLRESEAPHYLDTIERVVKAHSSQFGILDGVYSHWPQYFGFAASLARRGADETAIVLNGGYLDTVFDRLYIEFHTEETKRKHIGLLNNTKAGRVDMTPLFEFLHGVLNEYVDIIDDAEMTDDDQYEAVGGGVVLRPRDIRMLAMRVSIDKSDVLLLFYVASQRCSLAAKDDWLEYAPGKLFGTLLQRRPLEFVREFEKTLIARFEEENASLPPLLGLALHYLLVKKDESKDVMKQVGKELVHWERSYAGKILRFFEVTAKIARIAVIDSCFTWVPAWLDSPKKASREGVTAWLTEHVFVDPQPNLPETASRIRAMRMLATRCSSILIAAYRAEKPMGHREDMMTAMEVEAAWLTQFDKEVQSLNEGSTQDSVLTPEVQIEYNESKSTLSQLRIMLEELKDWERTGATTSASTPMGMGPSMAFMAPNDLEEEDEFSSILSDADEDIMTDEQ